jgi:hypothetical protein
MALIYKLYQGFILNKQKKLRMILNRINRMQEKNNYPDAKIDIVKNKNDYICSLVSFKKDMVYYLRSTSCSADVIDSLSLKVSEYIKKLEDNRKLEKKNPTSFSDAFNLIVKSLNENNIDYALDCLIFLIQVYGFSRENPLIRMKNYKIVNTAWRNGSVEGYPLILILDALKKMKILNRSEVKTLFLHTNSEYMILFGNVFDLLKQGNAGDSILVFEYLLNNIFSNDELSGIWLDSFKHIVSISNSDISIDPNKSVDTKSNNDKPDEQKKICISGMGWSGSGAVHAYIKEFADVEDIDNEIQHLSGVVSMRSLREAFSLNKDFFNELIKFFASCLFGFNTYDNYSEYRTILNSHQLTIGNGAVGYALHVRSFCEKLSEVINRGTMLSEIPELNEILLSAITKASECRKQRFMMFDNIIKMYRLSEIDFLDNAVLLCVNRDPRSNYVALCNENIKFDPSVYKFINTYRRKRQQIEKEYNKVKKKERVKFIRFEDFVCSDEYRKEIAGFVGLNLYSQKKESVFKPWVSIKNVDNYKSFPDKRAIRIIEKELSEYLWDNKTS